MCLHELRAQNGERQVRLGYWGDVLIGPFLSYGLRCENADLLKKQNRVYVKVALRWL